MTRMSASFNNFIASRDWFEKFNKRSGIHSVTRHGEGATLNKSSQKMSVRFQRLHKGWKLNPSISLQLWQKLSFLKENDKDIIITWVEKVLSGNKLMKDKLILLFCGNTSDDYKMEPSLGVYHSETLSF